MTSKRRVPLLKIRHHYSPSSDLAEVELFGTFKHINGKRYMLIDRDPWLATVIRYTFVDEFLARFSEWVSARFKR